jgi:hypothetical protein
VVRPHQDKADRTRAGASEPLRHPARWSKQRGKDDPLTNPRRRARADCASADAAADLGAVTTRRTVDAGQPTPNVGGLLSNNVGDARTIAYPPVGNRHTAVLLVIRDH